MINFNNILSISKVNQNFSIATKKTDKEGSVVIMKNNQPKYVLMTYKEFLKLREKGKCDET